MSGFRRGHALGLALIIVTIYFLFFSSSETDFRKTTEAGLSRRRGILRGDLSDADLTAKTNQQLQMILDEKSIIARPTPASFGEHKKVPYTSTISFDDTDEISVAGRKSMHKEKPKYPVDRVAGSHDESMGEAELSHSHKTESARDEGEELAREELQGILKKSPIIIFSKSYCPYSRRAKALLLETYNITPAPYVVELDLMTSPLPKPHSGDFTYDDDAPAPTLGLKIQGLLGTLTGRRTVPNIMINSESLGGSDDIGRLHAAGTLKDEILKMGGKRIVSVELTARHDES